MNQTVPSLSPMLAGYSNDASRILDAPPRFIELLPIAIYTCDADGKIRWFNRRAAELWGRAPRIGDDDQRFCGAYKLYHLGGQPMRHEETPMAHVLKTGTPVDGKEVAIERPDGSRATAMVHIDPIQDGDGQLLGAINCFHDITDRKRAEERQKALLDELNHRVKNTLATVQSLAAQTIRGADVPKDMREAFERRLLALSRTHDHLTRARWESADLESILHDIFAPYQGGGGRNDAEGRIRLEGEPVKLKPKPALTLAMVLHELATNAAKYGSLSAPGGLLAVAWAVTDGEAGRSLQIEWRESGGPAVRQPQHRGFGSRLVERGITKELKGSARISFDPDGVRCSMGIPV
jgi:two-component sensor histidine kinase